MIAVEVTEYQCMCEQCGTVTEAPLSAELGGAPKVGPHAQTVAMALRFDAGLPVSAISRVFDEVFHLPFSPGGLSQMFERNMAKLEPATIEVRNRLFDEPLIFADETGWWKDGGRAWLWATTTPEVSVFRISPRRDRDTFQAMVPTGYPGIVATDAYSADDSPPEARHPQCWGHVLRTARDIVYNPRRRARRRHEGGHPRVPRRRQGTPGAGLALARDEGDRPGVVRGGARRGP